VKTYSPADIIISFNNKRIVGYAKGTYVKVARNSESYKLDVGTLGDATQTEMLDNSGKVTITVQAASSTNDDLSTFLRNAKLRRGPRSAVFQMVDLNGATLHHAEQAFIEKPADEERGDEAGNVEWTLICANLDMFLGGAST
jgi:hypothetical protein